MQINSRGGGDCWEALRERLESGARLRHVAGMRHEVTPEIHCPFHSHGVLEIVYHPTGSGLTHLEDGGVITYAPGDVVIYAAGVRHDQQSREPGMDCCIHVQTPDDLVLSAGLHIGPVEDSLLRTEMEFLSRHLAGDASTTAVLLDLRATATLLQLLEQAFVRREVTSKAERHIAAAEAHIRECYADIRSVNEIATAVGLGRDHLRHLFRKLRGRSLVGYLAEVRLSRAKVMLAHSKLPLKAVASACGFADEYYFSSVFRRIEGIPPGKYRERVQAGDQRPARAQRKDNLG